MPGVTFNIDSYSMLPCESRHRFSVTEDELASFLKRIPKGNNPLQPTTSDLMRYLEGQGEFALQVELANDHPKVRDLLTRLARLIMKSSLQGENIYVHTLPWKRHPNGPVIVGPAIPFWTP